MNQQAQTQKMTDADLLSAIQQNINTQKMNKFDSSASTDAREANRVLFVEAARRNLKGGVR